MNRPTSGFESVRVLQGYGFHGRSFEPLRLLDREPGPPVMHYEVHQRFERLAAGLGVRQTRLSMP